MKKIITIAIMIAALVVIIATPALANPTGAPPTNPTGYTTVRTWASYGALFGQEVSTTASLQMVDDTALSTLGLTPPGNTPTP